MFAQQSFALRSTDSRSPQMRSLQFAALALVAHTQGITVQSKRTQCHSLNKFVLLDGFKSQGSQKDLLRRRQAHQTRRFEACALLRAEIGDRHHHRQPQSPPPHANVAVATKDLTGRTYPVR